MRKKYMRQFKVVVFFHGGDSWYHFELAPWSHRRLRIKTKWKKKTTLKS